MLRSSLCIAMARAIGAAAEDAIATAASIELMHNALLVHDDIEDASDERRGTPTLHALHGVPLALNAGDAMGLLSLRPLNDNLRRLGLATALGIFEETERMALGERRGPGARARVARDNRHRRDRRGLPRMVLKKTCWLAAIHPLPRRLPDRRARSAARSSRFVRLGFFLGAAFQIQDDLLNLEAGEAYGKEINGDICEGKRTLMLIHALRHAGRRGAHADLVAFLDRRAPRALDRRCRERYARCSSAPARIEHARAVARGLAGAALYEFDQYFGEFRDSRDLRFIRSLVTWVLERSH